MTILKFAGLSILLVLAAFTARSLYRDGQRIKAVLALLSLAAYLTWPPDIVALDQDCRPDDFLSEASSILHGRRFWRGQHEALTKERHAIEYGAFMPGKEHEDWIEACSHVARVRSVQG